MRFYEDSANAGNCWTTAPEASLATPGSQAASRVGTKAYAARKGNGDLGGISFMAMIFIAICLYAS